MKDLLRSPIFYFPTMMMSGRYSLNRLFEGSINIPLQFTLSFLIWISFLLLINKKINLKYNLAFLLNKSKVFYTMYVFLLFSLISVFYTPNINSGIEKAFEITVLLVICIVTIMIFQNGKDFYILAMGYVLNSLILFMIALPQLITFNSERIAVLGGGPNVFGRLMFFGLISAIYVITCNFKVEKETKKIKNILLVTAIIMFILGIIVAGSRGVYIGTITSLIIYGYYFISKKTDISNIVKSLFIIGSVITVFSIVFFDKLIFYYNYRMKYLFTDLDGGKSVFAREVMRGEAKEYFLDNPIFGVGLSGFKELSSYKIYPHNIILEFLSELGLFGGLLFVVFTLQAIYLMKKSHFERVSSFDNLALPFLSGMFIFIFISSQFSGDFFDNRLFFIVILLLEIRKKFVFKESVKV